MACDMLAERDPTCIPTSAVRCVACHPHIGTVRPRSQAGSGAPREAWTGRERYYALQRRVQKRSSLYPVVAPTGYG